MPLPDYYGTANPTFDFGITKQLVASTYTRPSDATAYTAGDIIGNSLTAGQVTPITFANAARRTPDAAGAVKASGRIVSARCVVAPASSVVIIAAFDFDLLIFRPGTSIPLAAAGYPADNAALVLTAAAQKELICIIPFVATAWRSGAGSVSAGGATGRQKAVPSVVSPSRFDLSGLTSPNLVAVMQAKSAWTPGAVVNTFDFVLAVEND